MYVFSNLQATYNEPQTGPKMFSPCVLQLHPSLEMKPESIILGGH